MRCLTIGRGCSRASRARRRRSAAGRGRARSARRGAGGNRALAGRPKASLPRAKVSYSRTPSASTRLEDLGEAAGARGSWRPPGAERRSASGQGEPFSRSAWIDLQARAALDVLEPAQVVSSAVTGWPRSRNSGYGGRGRRPGRGSATRPARAARSARSRARAGRARARSGAIDRALADAGQRRPPSSTQAAPVTKSRPRPSR